MNYFKKTLNRKFLILSTGLVTVLVMVSQAGSLNPVDSISAGGYHTLALKESGTLWAWGNNYYGELGTGNSGGVSKEFTEGIDSKVPVQVGTDNNWYFTAAGIRHSLAIKEDGSLWAWGWNKYGQLGLGDTGDRDIPVKVSTHSWSSVYGGGYHSLAIREDGTLWAWGRNEDGQLGVGDNDKRTSPSRVGVSTRWVTGATGGSHTVFLKDNDTLWAWGHNGYDQLGLGEDYDIGESTNIPVVMKSDENWVIVCAGYNHTLGIKEKDDTRSLWSWGLNNYGELGHGGKGDRTESPEEIAQDTQWKAVSGGWYHTLGIQKDNTLHAWGRNEDGQLGLGHEEDQLAPKEVSTGSWILISAGGAEDVGEQGQSHLDKFHSLGLRENQYRKLNGWGSNNYGQLGQDNIEDKYSPARTYLITNYGVEVPGSIVAGSTFTLTVTAEDGDSVVSYFSGSINLQSYLSEEDTQIGTGELSIKSSEITGGISVIENQTYTAAEDILIRVSDSIENTGTSSPVSVKSSRVAGLQVSLEPEYIVKGETCTVTAEVMDIYGNGVENVDVEFSITGGIGTLNKSSGTSKTDGKVEVEFYPYLESGYSQTADILVFAEGFTFQDKIKTGVEVKNETGGTVYYGDAPGTRINVPGKAILKDVRFFIIGKEDMSPEKQRCVSRANDNSPDGKIITPAVRGIEAYGPSGEIYGTFEDFIEIEIPYVDTNDDGRVDGTELRAKELKILRLNETLREWDIVADGGINQVDRGDKRVRAELKKLSIFTIGSPVKDSLDEVAVYPNPVNFSEAVRGTVKFQGLTRYSKIEIYDITGRRVKILKPDTPYNDGQTGKAEWDGKNESGREVAMGLYIFTVTDPEGNRATGKFGVGK